MRVQKTKEVNSNSFFFELLDDNDQPVTVVADLLRYLRVRRHWLQQRIPGDSLKKCSHCTEGDRERRFLGSWYSKVGDSHERV